MPQNWRTHFTRREWLSASMLASGSWIAGAELFSSARFLRAAEKILSPHPEQDPFAGGKQLGNVDFVGEASIPLDTPYRAELDGRLNTDLSSLTLADFTFPIEHFYIRSRSSQLLDLTKPWTIRIGSGEHQSVLTMAEIIRESKPQGIHLMECSGNSRMGHFGLLGAAEWTGMPISKITDRLHLNSPQNYVLVSGFDTYATHSEVSIAGASWIFPWDALVATGAFLATKMAGEPLTRDHGFPVRLMVPSWYGCVSIKWVDEIKVVDDSTEATSQMQEYASRTHQQGVPNLARDYALATVDPAAVPIRVEKWLVNNQIKYRVVGILWGGSQPVRNLEIKFNPDEPWSPVQSIPRATVDSWSFWTHAWTPQKPGTYAIQLRVPDPSVRTIRLDMNYYARSVEISEI
jgi:DMSO/TMAO reductase YedYZ molybdopterin-dependent catalytic subunit